MKLFPLALLLLAPQPSHADTLLLQDGTRIECEVTGDMEDTLLVKTKYGSLTIKKTDIRERIASPAAESPAAAAPAEISTAAPAQVSTAAPAQAAETATVAGPAPELSFTSVPDGGSSVWLIYSAGGVIVATETLSADGKFQSLEGTIPDGKYTEAYPSGRARTIKTMLAGKTNGTLKAYYPSGALQAEADYLAGRKQGLFRYFTEEGAILLEASYSMDKLNGWKKEFGPDGAVISSAYYVEDKVTLPPAAKAETPSKKPSVDTQQEQPPAQSLVSVKVKRLARGERFSFSLDDKYVGKVELDTAFNLMRIQGKIPDGPVKVFSKEGQLEKEFLFEDRDLKLLRVYDASGKPSEYLYEKDKAVKQ